VADAKFDCPKYEPHSGSRRCRHYLANGACSLADEFMCVEWLRANRAARLGDEAPASPTMAPARDLFGNPIEPPPPAIARRSLPTVSAAVDAAPTSSPAAPVSDEAVASFGDAGLEVALSTEAFGDLWIVPAYTGSDRLELSAPHAALLAAVASVFPGAQVTAVRRAGGSPLEGAAR
jgi:hypothetical protein